MNNTLQNTTTINKAHNYYDDTINNEYCIMYFIT